MPDIKSYDPGPGSIASPLVGVARLSPKGEGLRQFAQDIGGTKNMMEQLRGQRMSDLAKGVYWGSVEAGNVIAKHIQNVNTTKSMVAHGQAASQLQKAQGQTNRWAQSVWAQHPDDPQQAEQIITNGIDNAVNWHNQDYAGTPGEQDPTGLSNVMSSIHGNPDDPYPERTAATFQPQLDDFAENMKTHYSGLSINRQVEQLHQGVSDAVTQAAPEIANMDSPNIRDRVDKWAMTAQPINKMVSNRSGLMGNITETQRAGAINSLQSDLLDNLAGNLPTSNDYYTNYKFLQNAKQFMKTGVAPDGAPTAPMKWVLTPKQMEQKENQFDAASNHQLQLLDLQNRVGEVSTQSAAIDLEDKVDNAGGNTQLIYNLQSQAQQQVQQLQGARDVIAADKTLPDKIRAQQVSSYNSQIKMYDTAINKSNALLATADATARREANENYRNERRIQSAEKLQNTQFHSQQHVEALRDIDSLATNLRNYADQNKGGDMQELANQALTGIAKVKQWEDQGAITPAEAKQQTNYLIQMGKAATGWEAANTGGFLGWGSHGPVPLAGSSKDAIKKKALQQDQYESTIYNTLSKWDTQRSLKAFGMNNNYPQAVVDKATDLLIQKQQQNPKASLSSTNFPAWYAQVVKDNPGLMQQQAAPGSAPLERVSPRGGLTQPTAQELKKGTHQLKTPGGKVDLTLVPPPPPPSGESPLGGKLPKEVQDELIAKGWTPPPSKQ